MNQLAKWSNLRECQPNLNSYLNLWFFPFSLSDNPFKLRNNPISCETPQIPKLEAQRSCVWRRTTPCTLRNTSLSILAIAKTRGAHAAYPLAHNPRPRASLTRDSIAEAPQASAIPPSKGKVPSNPPQCRYETRRPPTTPGASTSRPKKSVRHPPTKKTRVSGLGVSSAPPQPQPPTIESLIPTEMTPEVIIRRPMVTQPPIEGNLDCRARPFHSELCFDMETFRQQPELRDSFYLLQRYHMEHLMTPRDFLYPRVALDFY